MPWRRVVPKTPMEKRALEAAEQILEASGLRYQSGQIAGLALILVTFAEHEIELAERARAQPPAVDADGSSRKDLEQL